MQYVHPAVTDPHLLKDFERLNQLLEIQSDNGPSFELLNEATRIRRTLAADTLAPDWLRDMAAYVVEELRVTDSTVTFSGTVYTTGEAV